MEQKEQTAVEWLVEKYNYITWLRNRDEISALKADKWRVEYLLQAKEMEKQQKMQCWEIEMTRQELELKAKEFDSKLKQHPMSSEELQKVLCDFAEALRQPTVSFSIFDKVYMDSPFGIYTGIVKDVKDGKMTIESHSPTGNGTMLAEYDIEATEWQKY